MAESPDVLLGRIDERTAAMQSDIADIKKGQTDLYNKYNTLRSDVDILQTEHTDHLKQCAPVTNVFPGSAMNLPKWASFFAGGGFVGGAAMSAFVIGKVLKWW